MHELVKSGSATEKGAVIHTYMSGQQTIVCNDNVASDNAIVPDVRAGHKKIFATDFGDAAPGTAAMDRAVLTKIGRSEEHTSELQSLRHLVCRLLLEKKKNNNK